MIEPPAPAVEELASNVTGVPDGTAVPERVNAAVGGSSTVTLCLLTSV